MGRCLHHRIAQPHHYPITEKVEGTMKCVGPLVEVTMKCDGPLTLDTLRLSAHPRHSADASHHRIFVMRSREW